MTHKDRLKILIPFLLCWHTSWACAELPALLREALAAPASKQYVLVRRLQTYSLLCWDVSTRAMLGDIIAGRPAHWKEWILLAGSLQMEQPLREILAQCGVGDNRAEAVQLGLARCGDKPLLRQLMRAMRERPLNDEFVYRYAPVLVYVRQDTAIHYLLDLIMLRDRNCSDATMETTEALSCAYRLMELVAPVIADFPIPWDPLTEELDTPDYERALTEVRQWISEQRGPYRLRTDIY